MIPDIFFTEDFWIAFILVGLPVLAGLFGGIRLRMEEVEKQKNQQNKE